MPFLFPMASFAALVLAAGLCLFRVFSKRFYIWLAALALTVVMAFPTLWILLPLALMPENTDALLVEVSHTVAGTPALLIGIFDLGWLAFLLLLAFALRGDASLLSSRKSRNENEYLKSRDRMIDFTEL